MRMNIIPMFEIRENVKGKEIPSLIVSWIAMGEDVGEVALSINVERYSQLKCLKKVLADLIELMTLGVRVGDEVEELGFATSLLSYVSESPHYPFTYVAMGFHEGFEEESRPHIIATIHRMAKKPFPILPYNYLKHCSAELCVTLDEGICTDCLKHFLATALASLLTAKTRRGYTLALILAQALPLFENFVDKDIFVKVTALTMSYLYTLFGKRVVGEISETLRHLVPEPPKTYNFSGMLKYLQRFVDAALERGDLKSNIGILSNDLRLKLYGHNEVIFGRAAILKQRLQEKLGSKKVSTLITIVTEQWGSLQRDILENVMNPNGTIIALYTQASIHNIVIENIVSSWIKDCRIQHKLPVREINIDYVLISATDACIVDNIDKIIEDRISKSRGGSEDVLVLAQGPASLSIPLYLWAKKKGFTAIMI